VHPIAGVTDASGGNETDGETLMNTRPQALVPPATRAFAAALSAAVTVTLLGALVVLFQPAGTAAEALAKAAPICDARPPAVGPDPCYRVYVVQSRREALAAAENDKAAPVARDGLIAVRADASVSSAR
jgi:hypothetical protein